MILWQTILKVYPHCIDIKDATPCRLGAATERDCEPQGEQHPASSDRKKSGHHSAKSSLNSRVGARNDRAAFPGRLGVVSVTDVCGTVSNS
jgi:hypothetical protein